MEKTWAGWRTFSRFFENLDFSPFSISEVRNTITHAFSIVMMLGSKGIFVPIAGLTLQGLLRGFRVLVERPERL
jgi:hypothetical protein